MSAKSIDQNSFEIFIIGSLTLQNEFLLYVIKKEIGVDCTIFDRDLNSFSKKLDEERAVMKAFRNLY